jgi:zinc transporter ZupT
LLGARWAIALTGAAGALTMVSLYMLMPRARHIR